MFGLESAGWAALAQVILIDLVLAGDNAIVVGMAAAGAPADMRKKVIFFGIGGAVVLRIILALMTVQLLQIVGLLFAGGVLLLWVCWKLYRELREAGGQHASAELYDEDLDPGEAAAVPRKTFGQAMWQVIVADVSMSLDNVLAVAGAAKEHPYILVFGLMLSIALMGVLATWIARVLDKHRWLGWLGLLIILYVALTMMWDGGLEVLEALEV